MEHTVTMGDVKIKTNIDRSVTFYVSYKIKDIYIHSSNKESSKIKKLLGNIKVK